MMADETPREERTVERRVYRRLLRLYPRGYRDLYGTSMEETFALRTSEARRTRGPVTYGWVVVREMGGLVITAVRQRLAGRPTGSSRQPARRGERELFGSLGQEMRHAVRRLMRAPGFTAATVVTLALGIGANAAIFSVVDGVVLRPLPYPAPEELVWLHHAAPGVGVEADLELTRGLYLAYGESAPTLEAIALFRTQEGTLTDAGDPERIAVTAATFTLEDVLQVPPALGRWIREDDTFADGASVVVLSHALWQRRYGGDRDILDRGIQISGFPFVVVGVMPRDFAFPDSETLAWVPRVVPTTASFGGFSDRSVARLRSGVTPADAERDLNTVIPTLPDRFPGSSAQSVVEDAKLAALVRPLKQHIVGNMEQTLWILLGTVGFVLLIACANVANLLLVRAEGRQREVAVRTALGAPRSRIVRFFLAESVVLTTAGAVLGLGLTLVGVRALIAFGPANIPRLDQIGVNTTVLGFTGVISGLAAFVFGAIPLSRGAPDVVVTLKEGGRAATTGHTRFRARNVLIVAQIALALVLLVGSGLMVRSFWHLQQIDPGFRAENVLTFDIGLPPGDYPEQARPAAFQQQLLDRLSGLPGVVQAGAVSCLPLSSWCGGDPLYEEGVPRQPGSIPPIVAIRRAAPSYFETAEIPLLAGRYLDRRDHEQVTNVAVVSATLVERFWPDEDPLGRRVFPGGNPTSWYTIVGVVGDVGTGNVTESPSPLIYLPMVSDGDRGSSPRTMTFVLRTAIPPLDLAAAVRREVREMNRNIPVAHMRTLEDLVAESGIQMAFTMLLLIIAAAVALTLGAVGVYGVISYVVGQRRSEIGVRIALGARGGQVRRMVLGQGTRVAAVGVLLGLGGAMALTRLMGSLLYGVAPTDPITYGSVSVVLFVVTLLAAYLPARRAAAVDPVEALRAE